MRKGILGVLAVWILGATQVFAQGRLFPLKTPNPAFECQDPKGDSAAPPVLEMRSLAEPAPYRIWAQSEYLLWWVKNGPMPAPLVTTGSPNDPIPGAIGQFGTRTLFGGSSVDYGAFSGGRLTIGGWLTCDCRIGFEASGFLLEQKATRFSAASDNLGTPPLYLPAFSPVTNQEGSVTVADPLQRFGGSVVVSSLTQLWGGEANGVMSLWRKPKFDVRLLGGFRYLDLHESLQLTSTTNDLTSDAVTTLQDGFNTRNQFYGGQLGTQMTFRHNRLSLDVTGKVALGATHQVVDINGSITQSGLAAPTPGTFPGGFFAQPTNIGRQTANQFTVIPQVTLKAGYDIANNVRVFAGYDFLYWNQVVRPGSQVDHNVNLTQSPVFGNGTLTGQSSPAPQFNRSDFWAQGVSFGFELRF